jgi:hypothetical protein
VLSSEGYVCWNGVRVVTFVKVGVEEQIVVPFEVFLFHFIGQVEEWDFNIVFGNIWARK